MKELIPYGHMVQEYYIKRLRDTLAARKAERSKIKTKAAAEKFVLSVRQKLLRSFGPQPPKTPLNPIVSGKIEKDSCIIEKIIFESRPGFPVTANFYLPKKLNKKCPGIIGTCGHSPEGKACEVYQRYCAGLANKGFAVLIYDPISQGERKQYINEKHPLSPTGLCDEHNMLGNNMQLNGEFFGMWRAWDGIRALDYLLTRPEIDPKRVGVTGNSGGGTLSSFLNALDERFTMAAPSCFITTYLKNIENELPQDSEQTPPNFFKFGLEMADFFIARAPRPVLILGQRDDFFDARGVVETYEEVKNFYKLLGAEKNVECFIGPDSHGYHLANREAMYKFFCKHAKIKAPSKEPDLATEKEVALACVPKGQILKSLKNIKTVFNFTAEKGISLEKKRKKLPQDQLGKKALSLLGIKMPKEAPFYRKLRQTSAKDNIYANRFALETEPGIQAILYSFTEGKSKNFLDGGKNAILYIPHLSVSEDVNGNEFALSDLEADVFALDPRGVGESLPMTCGMLDFFSAYDNDFFYACIASMLGESYLGGKVKDALSAMLLLKKEGYKNIHITGRGLGALTAAFAGFLSKEAKQASLKNALLSYHDLTQVPAYKWPFSCLVKGILKDFDLPDIYKAMSSKKLTIQTPWDEKMKPLPKSKCIERAKGLGLSQKLLKF